MRAESSSVVKGARRDARTTVAFVELHDGIGSKIPEQHLNNQTKSGDCSRAGNCNGTLSYSIKSTERKEI